MRPKGTGPASLAAALAALSTIPASAQGEVGELKLITDRPDFTESAAAVPPLHLQAEMGATYESLGGESSVTLPGLLLRLGLVRSLEARLGLPSYALEIGDEVIHRTDGVELGAKWVLPIGDISSIGLLPFVEIPIVPSDMRESGATAGLIVVWALDFTDRVGVGVNLGAMMHGLGGLEAEVVPEYSASLALGISLLDWLGVYVEGFAFFRMDGNHAPAVDGGFTLLVTPRVQLDLSGGWITEGGEHGGFVGVGASILM